MAEATEQGNENGKNFKVLERNTAKLASRERVPSRNDGASAEERGKLYYCNDESSKTARCRFIYAYDEIR